MAIISPWLGQSEFVVLLNHLSSSSVLFHSISLSDRSRSPSTVAYTLGSGIETLIEIYEYSWPTTDLPSGPSGCIVCCGCVWRDYVGRVCVGFNAFCWRVWWIDFEFAASYGPVLTENYCRGIMLWNDNGEIIFVIWIYKYKSVWVWSNFFFRSRINLDLNFYVFFSDDFILVCDILH